MAHDVFISHSSQNKTVADAVCHALEAAKIRCWIAPRDVPAGKEWAGAIIDAINSSRVMVLVFSADANTSPQVRREVERALNKGIPVLPFRIENTIPTDSMEFFLGSVHWLDAFPPPYDKYFEGLVTQLKQLLPTGSQDQSAPAKAPPNEKHGEMKEADSKQVSTPTSSRDQTAPTKVPPVENHGDVKTASSGQVSTPTAAIPFTAVVKAEFKKFEGPYWQIGPIGFTRDMRSLVVTAAGGIYTIDLRDNTVAETKYAEGFRGMPTCGLSEDTQWLAYSIPKEDRDTSKIFIMDLHSVKSVASFEPAHKVDSIALYKNNHYALVGMRKVRWNEDERRGLNRFLLARTYSEESYAVAVGLYETTTGKLVRRYMGGSSPLKWIAISPNESVFAGADLDTIRVWNIGTANEIYNFECYWDVTQRFQAEDIISFSKNGQFLGVSTDKITKIWDMNNGKQISICDGHEKFIMSVKFSPNNNYVASGSDDSTVRLWDVQTGRELVRFVGNEGRVVSIIFSPDGHYIASGTTAGTVRLWEIPKVFL